MEIHLSLSQQDLEIAMAISLLFIAFFLKLCVNRKVTKNVFITSVLELPMDVIFLSLGFTVSMMIVDVDPSRFRLGLFMFMIQLISAVIVIIFCRSSLKAYKDKEASSQLLFALTIVASYLLSLITYIIVAIILFGGSSA